MKNFIKSLELRWSDLFILIGFIPFALFLVFGQAFMQTDVPSEVPFTIPAIIVCFLIMVLSWGAYLYLEHKRGNVKFSYFILIFIGLALLNVIVIFAQPRQITEAVVCRNVNDFNSALYPGIAINDVITVVANITPTHKLFFALDIVSIILFLFIGLFVFPKRFKSINFIKYLGYAVFAFMLVLILYSYITEYNSYVPFIKNLFAPDKVDPATYAVKSFIIHRNAYGMAMLLGIIFAMICHSMDKKWCYYALMAFFFANMIFSYSKTSILIAALIIVIYVYFRLIYAFNENKKRNTILLIIYSSVIVLGLGLVAISLLTKGKVFGFIYNIFNASTESGSLDLRSFIWDNCFQLLRDGNWLVGRGFGIFNVVLFKMNDVNGDHVFPSHSSWVNMLTEGGIIYLFALIALCGYAAYIIAKSYKKNPNLVVAMAIGALSFFLYSFIETIHYLFYVFLLPPFIFYEVEKKKELLPSNEKAA